MVLCQSCENQSGNNSSVRKKSSSNLLIELKGRNDFIAKLEVEKNSKENLRNKFNVFLKVHSHSKTYVDTILKGDDLEVIYSKLMPILMKVPYDSPVSVNFNYENKKFEEVEAIEGTKIDTSGLLKFLIESKIKKSLIIDLNQKELYEKPRYTIDSPEAKDGKMALEKCLKSVIKLKFEEKEFNLDKDVFATWLHLDTAMKVKIETDPMQAYLQKIAEDIETPLSEILESFEKLDSVQMEEIVFSRLNINNQISEIIKLIPKGSSSNLDLIMSQRGLPKGIKKGHRDFVEVSIAEQKLWLFKGGNLLLETDVVTGNKRYGRSTPPGNYSVLYKVRNKVLRGRGYASFVSYWMPFYGGYGLHDANWRRRFGSSIYESSGSHGCVNIPPKLAPIVYNNVEVGTPVIIW